MASLNIAGWRVLQEFAVTEMSLPQAESKLEEVLGDRFRYADWESGLQAVLNAENDVEQAINNLDKLTVQLHGQTLSDFLNAPNPAQQLSQSATAPPEIAELEKSLEKTVKTLHKRRRIDQPLTLEEMLNPSEERVIGDSACRFEGGDDAIVAHVHGELDDNGRRIPDFMQLDPEMEEEEAEEQEEEQVKISDVLQMCESLEKLCLVFGLFRIWRLVTVGNLPDALGQRQTNFVHLCTVVTEESIVGRTKQLQEAVDQHSLSEFAQEKVKQKDGKVEEFESWNALLSLFHTNSREELIELLGFSKSSIAAQVAEAVQRVKDAAPQASASDTEDETQGTPHEPVVSFIEPENEKEEPSEASREGAESPPQSAGPIASETTPSEFSMSATSDGTKTTEIESTTTEHSLFNDDLAGTPQTKAAADFFSSMGTLRGAILAHMQVPHTNYALDSSVAATVASNTLKSNTFAIYPKDTSEIDKLLTRPCPWRFLVSRFALYCV
ncbi:hypothetical protein M422DRAFT_55104 [Sphaerobolus stellatus SS14]|uniref:Unplaced genomic scaffold SPHSTscaffold_263, whole genome shotgun sequence n=1 Tax=Sphaerobolus stellatus (strain SS14) TaxID=990650 RepID=A0A0C9UPN8_SPHS4|nr:hypothetical protein M422DRAFT_55104 [Sphaerobolus stellatus SS14]